MQRSLSLNPLCFITPLTAYCRNGSTDQDHLAPEFGKVMARPINCTVPTGTTHTTVNCRSITTAPKALTAPMCDTPSNGCCVFSSGTTKTDTDAMPSVSTPCSTTAPAGFKLAEQYRLHSRAGAVGELGVLAGGMASVSVFGEPHG